MAGLGAAALPFIACVALLAALILHVLSFASPYWAYSDGVGHFGLWRYAECLLDDIKDCYRYDMHWDAPTYLDAIRALECLTLIFWCVPMMIVPVYIYVALGLRYKCLLGCMALSILVGAICNVIGAIIFGVQIGTNDWQLGWCLIVCIVGGALGFVSFVVMAIATFNRPDFAIERHYPSGFYVDPYKNKLYVVENIDRYETLSEKSDSSPMGINPS
ncbi:hypothetical protein LOTGIDRAFT_236912 [Lottia gigantea]|uniref:Claudin n=1 Tax=Lottia gigantea TaxID=225164 RepID=V3YY10_LOTGI|nr:hypothetical protein LOTGIDRAFT_236912 [Lottia gigantea]ESO82998.1 hypothetical protein LOTGIDRAFT_236912 [Lottia gigantea]